MQFLFKASLLVALSSICQIQLNAMTIENTSGANVSNIGSEARQSGIVSKLDAGKLEINGVIYAFSPSRAKVFDLTGKQNQQAEIKPGMFVNFTLENTKDALRIVELRMVRP